MRTSHRMVCVALLSPGAALCQGTGQNPADTVLLDEVIVTARLFREDITRVPMSVQALSADFLDSRQLSSLYDLQYAVPGLVLNNRGMFGAGISLRGVSDEGGSALSVAPHLNGVYLGRSNLALARQFDPGRVEIVKGPQGTLYGRNATGGSINMFTRVPDPEFGARFEGSWGSFDTARIGGHVNLSGDVVTTRFAFTAAEGDGFIRNSIDARRFAEEDYWGVRASVRVQPNESLTIDAMLQRVEDDGAAGELWGPRRDRLIDPGDIHLTTVTLANPFLETVDDFTSVNVGYELSGLTLRSITGYARNVTHNLDDCAGAAELVGCVRGVDPLTYEQYSQEIRLESPGNEVVDWIAGAYWFDAHEFEKFTMRLPGPPRPVQDNTEISDSSTYAFFGDVTLKLAGQWRLNGGLRFTREDHRLSRVGTGLADNPTLRVSAGSWDSTSWRVGADFSPNPQVLVYANVATGFKSGGVTTDLLPNGEYDDYEPEENLAYEAGVTAKFGNGRSSVRASAFLYDFENMQVQTTTVIDGITNTVVDNAAAARIEGIDFSSTTQLDDHWSVTGLFVWLPRREFVEFIAASGATLTGNEITRASAWSASASVDWRTPLGGAGELSTGLDYNYRTSFFFTKENRRFAWQEPFGLLNANVRFDSARGGWYVFATARNLLDEDYFTQIFLQSAPGYPTRYEVGFGWRL